MADVDFVDTMIGASGSADMLCDLAADFLQGMAEVPANPKLQTAYDKLLLQVAYFAGLSGEDATQVHSVVKQRAGIE